MGSFVHADAGGGNVSTLTGVTWGTAGAATQNGDLAILVWTFQNTSTHTDPAGFTLVGTLDDGSARSRVYKRSCTGTESGDVSLVNGTVNRQTAVLYVVRGFSDVNAATSFAETVTGTSHDCPSVSFTGTCNILVAVSERLSTGTTNAVPPAGYGGHTGSEFGTGGSGGTYTGVADDGLTTVSSSPVDPGAWIEMVSGGTAITWTIALTPAAAVSVTFGMATETDTALAVSFAAAMTTFPSTPRLARVDLFVNGAWTDITADVKAEEDIVISNGKPDEAAQTAPSECHLTLKWADGKYNPKNPLGAYFGTIGRNTPIRVRLDLPTDKYRFLGEVSSWPPQRDQQGVYAWVPIVASGLLRRIGQGNQPLESSARRYYRTTSPVAYWPLMDGSGNKWASMLTGSSYRYPWVPSNSSVEYALGEGNLGPHGQALSITSTAASVGTWSGGYCVGSVGGVGVAGEFLFQSEKLAGELWFIVQTTGRTSSVPGKILRDEYSVQIQADGTSNNIQLWSYLGLDDAAAVNLARGNTEPLDAVTDGQLHHIRLAAIQSGANTILTVYLDGVLVLTSTEAGIDVGHAYHARFRYVAGADAAPVSVGHVVVWEGSNIPAIAASSVAALAYHGEAAGRRFERLCAQRGLTFQSIGDLDETLAMGYQFTDTLNDQLTEVEQTDAGLIYEPTTGLAIGYRTRASLYNQAAAVTIDFAAGELGYPFDPVDDDQNLRNAITGQRRDGGIFEVSQTAGPLSISEPPAGAGRYEDQVTVNVADDDLLPARIGWSLLLGTINEARYPKITVDLANVNVAANATLSAALLDIRVGDRIVITNTDLFNIYDDISLIVLGYTETLNVFTHKITFNCVPESPYQVLVLDNTNSSWLDPGDSTTLNEDLTTTETGVDVAVVGPLWSTSGGNLPVSIMIGGEEMSVTAISGASSPQTFTVTRSVNGVVKTHSTGAAVKLKRPGNLAL